MAVRQYIGARYVPIFADPIEWDNERTYEPLVMVQYEGGTYISRTSVPVGINILNETYWVFLTDWNAQIEQYRNEVLTFNTRIGKLETALPIASFSSSTVASAIDNIIAVIGNAFTSENTISDAIEAIADAFEEVFESIQALEDRFPIKMNDLYSNIIRGLYIEPEYLGDYTAFSGKYITNDASADNPFKPQGFCYTENSGMKQLLINNAEDRMRFVTMNVDNNTVTIDTNNKTGFAHANQMEFVPSKNRYYVNDGDGHILVCNSTFSVVATVSIPNENWAVFVYDRKNDKAYVVDYYSHIYTFNLDNNTITDTGIVLSRPVQDGTVTVQGAACYDNIIVFPISKSPTGMLCYDILSGEYLCCITINQNGDEVYPISEIEDVSFDNDGNMYFAAATILSAEAYCFVSTIWKCNIFTGIPVTSWWTNSTEKHAAYTECQNYTGFKSNGSSNFPFKSLESLSIHCQHAGNKIKTIYIGNGSAYSTNTAQAWYGFLYLTNMNAYIRFNSNNNITIHGTIELRNGCVCWLLNRAVLASCYNSPKNYMFRVDCSNLFGQTIEGKTGNDDAAITSILLIQYTCAVVVNSIVNTINIGTPVKTNQLHGFGYAVNVSPKTLDGSWT